MAFRRPFAGSALPITFRCKDDDRDAPDEIRLHAPICSSDAKTSSFGQRVLSRFGCRILDGGKVEPVDRLVAGTGAFFRRTTGGNEVGRRRSFYAAASDGKLNRDVPINEPSGGQIRRRFDRCFDSFCIPPVQSAALELARFKRDSARQSESLPFDRCGAGCHGRACAFSLG